MKILAAYKFMRKFVKIIFFEINVSKIASLPMSPRDKI